MRRNWIALTLFALAALLAAGLLFGIGESRLFTVNLKAGNGTLSGQVPLGQGGTSTTVAGQALLIKPHYTGQDADGRRWEVIADRADQVSGTVNVGAALVSTSLVSATSLPANLQGTNLATDPNILLTAVQARYYAPEGGGAAPASSPTYTLNARQGLYHQDNKTLHLTDNVVITGNGFTMRTPAVTAQIISRTAQGNQGVTITGPLGAYSSTLTGNTFQVDQTAGHITVEGNVKAHLLPQ